jgi:hypothetical protein
MCWKKGSQKRRHMFIKLLGVTSKKILIFNVNPFKRHKLSNDYSVRTGSEAHPASYTSGIQPGVRVPPGVREDILGGT